MLISKIVFKVNMIWNRQLLKAKNERAKLLYTFIGTNNYPKLGKDGEISNSGGNHRIKIGSSVLIDGILQSMSGQGEIEIADNSYIGPNSRIWSYKKIIIGKNVLISHNCNIFDSNCHPVDFVERRQDYLNLVQTGKGNSAGDVFCAPIVISDDVWIGANSCIMKGVTIGRHSIVAAGSVVVKSIPADVIVAGNPAQIVKYLARDENNEECKI